MAKDFIPWNDNGPLNGGTASVSVSSGGNLTTTAGGEVYTLEQVADALDHIQAKVHGIIKAKVGAYLEDKLGVRSIFRSPAGKVLELVLREVDRAIYDAGKRHFPGLNRRLLVEARKRREQQRNAE